MKNTGILRIQAFAARQSAPVEGVTVAVQGDGFTLHRITDATGSAAALRAGTWSSRAAREGLWHKAGSVAGVLVAALLDFALRVLLGSVPGLGIDYDVLLCPLVTAWYLLTELGSIAENAGALGAPMPQFLMRAIAALRAGISDRGGGDGNGGGAA